MNKVSPKKLLLTATIQVISESFLGTLCRYDLTLLLFHSLLETMLQINQRRYNLSYDPILDNYEQFTDLPKITHNGSKVLFGEAIDQGN